MIAFLLKAVFPSCFPESGGILCIDCLTFNVINFMFIEILNNFYCTINQRGAPT